MEHQFDQVEEQEKEDELSSIKNDKKLSTKRRDEEIITTQVQKKNYSQEDVDRIVTERMHEERKIMEKKTKAMEEERKEQVKKDLINNMKSFISNNLATSTISTNSLAAKNFGVAPFGLEGVLKSADMGLDFLLPQLTEQEWDVFCKHINKLQNDDESERKGVHPLVNEVIQAILNTISLPNKYKAVYEQCAADEDKIDRIPDISFVMANSESKTMSSIVMPLEIKKKGDVFRATNQSLGYLMTKLRDLLEIVTFPHIGTDSKLFGFCFGTDGYHLSLGYILIKECKMFICHSVGGYKKLPFWTTADR